MKKILTGIVLFLLCLSVKAQFTYDYLRAADNYFKKADYNSAAEYYEKYLNSGKGKNKGSEYNPYTVQPSSKKSAKVLVSSREQAIYNLAECYRLLNYHEKSAPYYKTVTEWNNPAFPLARYHYASALRALAKFSEAEKEFTDFISSYTNSDKYLESAKMEVANLQFIQQQLKRKDLPLFTVKKSVDAGVQGATYAPVWAGNNSLMFTSTRPDTTDTKKPVYTNRVYQATFSDGAISNVNTTALPQTGTIHQGVVSLSTDGSRMYLTRWAITDGKKTSSIYMSLRNAEGWSEPVAMNNEVNVAGTNAQQPFVMPDGKHLLFASDRPGGQGGFDLWIANLDASGNASNAVNLGKMINTKFDEQAPYFHEPSGSLVFSSNGRTGMGGFDFFQSKGKPGEWTEPVNMGYPVNSVKDDIYFASKGDAKNILGSVLISSDRDAACCLELFSIKKSFTVKQVSGIVVSCEDKQPLSGATVSIIDPSNNAMVVEKTTGDDGSYSFTIDEFRPLVAVANASGFEESKINFTGPDDVMITILKNPAICLEPVFPPPVGTIEVIPNIYFDYDSAHIKEESFVYLDQLAEKMIKKPNAVLEISGHTDSNGDEKYNMKLSEARAKAVVDYLVNKGVMPGQLVAKGYGETMPVAPNANPDGSDNPEGRSKNRRTEFKVLDR